MKHLILCIAICLVALTASAQSNLQVNAGNSSLNGFLTNMATDFATGKLSANSLKDELKFCFGLSYGDFNLLMSRGYNAGETYLVGMLHDKTGKSVRELIRNRKPGQGWGQLAHQLGIHPSELNKMRVAMKKKWKQKQQVAKTSGSQKGKAKGKAKNK